MKDLHGSAARRSRRTPASCFAVLADVERYQAWYPEVIRQVTVLERRPDGGVALAEATLSAPGVPLIGDLELRLESSSSPRTWSGSYACPTTPATRSSSRSRGGSDARTAGVAPS